MAFTFVHTADWQIGKSFGRFEPEKAAVLRQVRLDAIDRLARLAARHQAGHILVAGDIFDSEMLPADTVPRVLARLAGHREVTWHLLPGNHDPARPGGVWDGAARSARSAANIRLHLKPQPAQIAPDVFLLPAPLKSKAVSADPTAWMDAAGTPVGSLRIGLAHGSVQGFGSLGEAPVPIDADRMRTAGLAYLALGDWHGAKEVSPRAWYSGTPEPDSFADNAQGHALVVRLASEHAPPEVALHPTAQFHWIDRKAVLDGATSLRPLVGEIEALGAGVSEHLCKLELSGRISLSAATGIEQQLSQLASRLFDLRIDRRRLATIASDDDLAGLSDPALRAVAQRLGRRIADAEGDERGIAMRALEQLLAIAASAEETEPA